MTNLERNVVRSGEIPESARETTRLDRTCAPALELLTRRRGERALGMTAECVYERILETRCN
jgi:hypothetical protein